MAVLVLTLLFVVGSYAKPFNITRDGNFEFYRYQEKVVGGQPASDGQFPYQAELIIYGNHICGGSIYTKRWIITAAHCIESANLRRLEIIVGSNKAASYYDGQHFRVERTILHPQYQGAPPYPLFNNIGLIKTTSDIVFNPKVQPIKLGTHHVEGGETVVLSGWGKHDVQEAAFSSTLYYINLKTIDNDACGRHWSFVQPTYLCTFTKYGEGSCYGDAGGPLAHNGVLVGVASFGELCAVGKPDVFTRVSSYIDWIQSNARP